MHKAGKEIKEILPQVDLFIEVLDARIPFSSENPMLASIRGEKPCIKVLNKSDLADPDVTQIWQVYLEQEKGVKTLALTTLHPDRTKLLTELCLKILDAKAGSTRLIHALIMGIPNVGKSTLINILAGKTIAKTGNEPAVTKAQQRINIGHNITLLDTPGMLWPNLENKNTGYRLAVTGAIKDTAIAHDDVAFFALEYLMKRYPERLSERFQLEQLPKDEWDLMTQIGQKRGCLRAGGKVDMDKVAKILLSELRAGSMGAISLETPEMMEVELAELTIIREQKAAKKLARKQKRKTGRKNEEDLAKTQE